MRININHLSPKCLLPLVMLFFATNFAFAQRTLSGKITDAETGEALIGANVYVKGTTTGTITDIDGGYVLVAQEGATTLVVSYAGYTTLEVAIGAENTINITLTAGTELDEVVVVGYGSLSRKEVTSSVATLKAEDFNGGNINNAEQLLQGKVAGLSITRPGGDPNGGFNIRLRGLSSAGANSSPLIIIDGMVGASLSNIDPNDIASFDVLKDASAASIYGTRGAAGVILITTKRGAAGKSTVDYNGYVAFDGVGRTVQVTDASEYRELAGATDLGSETDWFDEVTQTGLSQVHNISLGGGMGNTSYRFSFNYRDVQGILRKSGFDQLNGRFSLVQKAMNDRLTLTTNLSATSRNSDFSFTEAMRYATTYNPTAPIKNADGSYYEIGGFETFNPVALIEQNVNLGESKFFTTDFRAKYDLTSDLSVSTYYARQSEDYATYEYYSKDAQYRGANRNGLARRSYTNNSNQLFELTGEYSKSFGGTSIRFLGGYSYQKYYVEGLSLSAGNFITDDFGFNNIGAAQNFADGRSDLASSYKESDKIIAFFGRATLNINDVYFATASLRREGSSRFGEDEKWGLFYGVSAGANIDKIVDLGAFDYLKVRAGYGVSGNRPGVNYSSLLTFSPVAGAYGLSGGVRVPAYEAAQTPNTNLSWEKLGEFNVGVEFGVMDYKLTGTLEYYNRTTSDLILYVTNLDASVNPSINGYRNVGELSTSGLEFTANYTVKENDKFSWQTGLLYNHYLSADLNEYLAPSARIANLGAPGYNLTEMILLEEGKPLGQIWGAVYEGINDDGSWNLKGDEDGYVATEDNEVIGSGWPTFDLGWSNNFRFGNFDFSILLRGTFGHDLVNAYRVFFENPVAGDVGKFNRVNTEYFDSKATKLAPYLTSHHVEDASFFKLDNASLGYNVAMEKGAIFSRLRFYVSTQNLFYITNYTGVDPEVRFTDPGEVDNGDFNTATPNPLAPGIDRRSTYLRSYNVTLGVNVGF